METVELGKTNKDVILLLHGGGLSWWNYSKTAESLEHHYHVVIPILNGHADSRTPFTSIENNAKEIISYIDETFGGHILLAGGLSLGGQVLVEMLSQRKDICDLAVIESTLVTPMKLTAALIAPACSLCYPLIKKHWFAKLQFRSLHIRAELFETYFKDSSRIKKEDMISFLKANSNYRLKDTISDCQAKTLILVGEKERGLLKQSAALLNQKISNSALEVLPQYTHGDLSINHSMEYTQKILRLIYAHKSTLR